MTTKHRAHSISDAAEMGRIDEVGLVAPLLGAVAPAAEAALPRDGGGGRVSPAQGLPRDQSCARMA
jgi:hypothetical protein